MAGFFDSMFNPAAQGLFGQMGGQPSYQPMSRASILGAGFQDLAANMRGQQGGALNKLQYMDLQRQQLRQAQMDKQRKREQEERERQAKMQLAGQITAANPDMPWLGTMVEAGYDVPTDLLMPQRFDVGTPSMKEFTLDSLARFQQSGNPTDLQRRAAPSGGGGGGGGGGYGGVSLKDRFKREGDLRDDYYRETGNFNETFDRWGQVEDLDPASMTGAEDLKLVFAYMKTLDPTSVVREGEQASAANAAGVPSAVMSAYNNLLGGGVLDEKARREMKASMGNLVGKAAGAYNQLAQRYHSNATEYGLNPNNIGLPGADQMNRNQRLYDELGGGRQKREARKRNPLQPDARGEGRMQWDDNGQSYMESPEETSEQDRYNNPSQGTTGVFESLEDAEKASKAMDTPVTQLDAETGIPEKSEKKKRPRVGAIEKGDDGHNYQYVGGDPTAEYSWKRVD